MSVALFNSAHPAEHYSVLWTNTFLRPFVLRHH